MAKQSAKRPGSAADRIIDAAFALASEQDWRRVSLGDIAARAGVTLGELAAHFSSKGEILVGFMRLIDEQVLNDIAPASEHETPRDRLFDIIMKRFDALAPYKAGMAAMLRAPDSDLGALAAGACRYFSAMGLMLEAAGISTAGWRGRLRVQGLAAIYPAVLRTWINEEAEDMPRTMAALDRWLQRAEALDQRLSGGPASAPESCEPQAPPPRRRTRKSGGGRPSATA